MHAVKLQLHSVVSVNNCNDDSKYRREAAELEQHTNSAPYLSGSKKRRRVVISIHSHLQKRENGKPGRQNLYVWQTKTSVKFPALLMKRRSLLMLVWVKEPSAYRYWMLFTWVQANSHWWIPEARECWWLWVNALHPQHLSVWTYVFHHVLATKVAKKCHG